MSSTDLILTLASGEEFFKRNDFWVYVNSLSAVKNSDFVILTDNMPIEVEDKLSLRNVIVKRIPKIEFLFRDRHKAYWDFINQSNHRYILVSDCRDVLFQKNPFDWIESSEVDPEHFVALTSEGFLVSQSGFATIDNFKFEQNIPDVFKMDTSKSYVINGGVALGTRRALMSFHFLIWSVMGRIVAPCTDQAAVNNLMSHLKNDKSYFISSPFDSLCLTGESVKEKVLSPLSDGNILKNPHGQTYHIIHQWDRIDSLKNVLA